MTVQGIGNGYGYTPALTPSERQMVFQGGQMPTQPAPKQKSFIGGLIKTGIVITLLAKALKTGGSYKSILKLAKKQGITEFAGKAKLFGKAYLKNLNPKNWKTTKKAIKLYSKYFGKTKTPAVSSFNGVKAPANYTAPQNIDYKKMVPNMEEILKQSKV